MTVDSIPFGKELELTPFGEKYLAQEENSARYYIPGKGVCVTEGRKLLWYELSEEEMDAFHFDEMLLNEYLNADFTPEELRALKLIQQLDEQAKEYYLHVVTTSNAGGSDQYAIFFSEPNEAFFMVHMDDLKYVNLITANIMAQASQSWLSDPHKIRLDERGAFEL